MQLNNIKGALLQGLYAINCKKDAGFYARQVCTKNRKVKKKKKLRFNAQKFKVG